MIKDMRLETQRLIIRPYIEDDFIESFKLMQDKELFKYKEMGVMTLDEYKGLFEWLLESYNVDFDGNFAYSFNIILKETGRCIGWVGLGKLVTDIAKTEIFYLTGIKYQNQGYATEASKAILEYGFRTIGLNEIVGVCMKENIASKRVMEKIGLKFRYIQEGLPKEFERCNGDPFYSLTKDEYLLTL
ncbi:GNAT family N-acetyltransferase [Clostridium sp. 19966]|uniref:GNAT family N-acetyltransferase n=1 Tax=Clostridium sp. 19966 TaxID=2768166 RepID=UPI0028DD98FA|nr:GNAT family N-acetyltransferase [Clostridium sp. 19966]MDT8719166.1 GNAT family N-acetyltransferase [Clostridium sp. 19966]